MSNRVDPDFIDQDYDFSDDDSRHHFDEFSDYDDFDKEDRDIDLDDYVDGFE